MSLAAALTRLEIPVLNVIAVGLREFVLKDLPKIK